MGRVNPLQILSMRINPYSAEPVLEIKLFFTCSNMGALICNYLLDEASKEHQFLTMNRQDGHLQSATLVRRGQYRNSSGLVWVSYTPYKKITAKQRGSRILVL
jgi:hypothetical protein